MKIGASYRFSDLDRQHIPADSRKQLAKKYLANSLANEILKDINIDICVDSEGIEYKCSLEIVKN